MQTQSTSLNAAIINAESIEVTFQNLPIKQPQKNGNWIGIWQGSTISYLQKPLWKFPIESNDPNGQQILGNLSLQRKPYVLGYALNKEPESICASVQFSPEKTPVGSPGIPFSNVISLAAYSANSLIINYQTPPGNIPSQYRNWIGLWPGEATALSENTLLMRTPITQQSNIASQAMTGITLAYKSIYTVGYASGEKLTDLSTTLTFKTGEALA